MLLRSFALLTAAASSGLAAVVSHKWAVEWVEAAPDGFARPVIGINGKWPPPALNVDLGDKLVIEVTNNLGNQSTSVHWHGFHHEGTVHMDGASKVTQCPIPPGESFTYEFRATHSGTYWYHAHVGAQYSDGLRAPLIVHDRQDPHRKDYDEEYILTLSDWYHTQTPPLLEQLFSITNVQVRSPLPQSGLINDGQKSHYAIAPGKKYKFHIINMSALASAILFFDAHDLAVVEVDGVYTHKTKAEHLYVSPGQRYSVIVEGKKEGANKNFAINAVFDFNPDYRNPLPQLGFPINATAYLQYDAGNPDPEPTAVDEFKVLDDLKLTPFDDAKLLGEPDQRIQLDFRVGVDSAGIPRGFFNNVTYVPQKVPTLYTALSVGKDAEDPRVYGQVNPFVIKHGQVIEVTLNNLSPGHHPFHLHGHHFQVIHRSEPNAGGFKEDSDVSFPASPMRRDTIDIHSLASAVIRFEADNPGVWMFHCHMEWHVPLGLAATFIESPLELQKIIPRIPGHHRDICEKGCTATEGNAAGNTDDHFDLSGASDPSHVPNRGAMWEDVECSDDDGDDDDDDNNEDEDGNDSGNGDSNGDGEDGNGNGNGDGNGDGEDGSGNGNGDGNGEDGDGNGEDGDGSDGSGDCPRDCTCSGPVILEPTDDDVSCDEDGVYVKVVTEAYYVTSTSTTTSTLCATPTP